MEKSIMSDKFDVKDFFNYMIAGMLWLLLFWQIDDVFNCRHFFFRLSHTAFFRNDFAAGVLSLVISFVIGILLRPLQWIPVCIFNIFWGKPIDWVLERKAIKPDCIQKLNWAKKAKKEFIRKIKYFVCFDNEPLSEDEIASVNRYFNLVSAKIDAPKDRLNHIETRLWLEQPRVPLIFDKMKNYQNLVESIMTPVLANVGILLFDRMHCLCLLLRILLFVVVVLSIFNCYKYHKSEYYKGVFRSVEKLIEIENAKKEQNS